VKSSALSVSPAVGIIGELLYFTVYRFEVAPHAVALWPVYLKNRELPRMGEDKSLILRQNLGNSPKVTSDENSSAELNDSLTIPDVTIFKTEKLSLQLDILHDR